MPTMTPCPGCTSPCRVPDDSAGASILCGQCGHVFDVPKPIEAPADVVVATVTAPTPLPEPAVNVAWSLALLLTFLLGIVSIGGLAAVWIAAHLGPEHPVYTSTFEKDEQLVMIQPKVLMEKELAKKNAFDRAKPPLVQPVLVGLFDGRLRLDGATDLANGQDNGKWGQDGPYALFRVNLRQGTNYHFHINGINILSRLRICELDGKQLNERWAVHPGNRLMLTFQPNRTDDYLLWVTTPNRAAGQFTLNIAPETRANPTQIDLADRPNYLHNSFLRVEDPLHPDGKQFGPYRDYEVTLQKGEEYHFAVTDSQFMPALQVSQGEDVVEKLGHPDTRRLDLSYRPAVTGKHLIRVTSEQYGLGNYTLRIGPKPVAAQTILGVLDDRGRFMDQRELRPSDPKLGSKGVFKNYLVALDQGKKYRIEMSLGDAPTSVTVFDATENIIANEVGKENAAVTLTVPHSGTHRIRVAAPLPKFRTDYTLRITTLP